MNREAIVANGLQESGLSSLPKSKTGKNRWDAFKNNPEERTALIESQAQQFLAQHGKLTFKSLINEGGGSLAHALQRYYPGGLYGIQEKFGVAVGQDHKPKGFWQDNRGNKVLQEAKTFYEYHGQLSHSKLAEAGRTDLIGALRYYPGRMTGLKRDLGLPLRTKVEKDYWTPEQIRNDAPQFYQTDHNLTTQALHEGGRSDLLAAINRKYPGRITKLRQDLGLERGQRSNKYWQDLENIEREAAEFNRQYGWITQNMMIENGRADLWSGIIRYYPGRVRALRDKLGIPQSKPENTISSDVANEELMKFLEVRDE